MTVWLFAMLSAFSSSVFALAVNDAIKATAVLNVRSTASSASPANILGEKSAGNVGTITNGPTSANGFTWWYVVWDTGSPTQGWSASTNLALNTPTPKNFSVNGGVQVTGTTNTRSTASTTGSLLASKAVGSTGVVVGGPTIANGYAWWKINWTGGPQNSWAVQDFLSSHTFPTITGVTVSCLPLSILTGGQSQCSASVTGTGSYSNAVNWYAGAGEISSSGLLTAPLTVPAGNSIVVAAQSVQDPTKSGQRTVGVSAPSGTVSSVSVSCSPLTVVVNQISQCTATVTGTGSYSHAVNWSTTPGAAINAQGLFVAPATVPGGNTSTVTATSVQNGTKSGTRALTITGTPGWSQPVPEVFRDTTGNGWYIEQWAGVTNNPLSPFSQSGEYGVMTTTTTAWGRVQFTAWANHRFNPVTANVDTLSFWVNVGKNEGEYLYVGLLNSGYTVMTYVPISTTPNFTPYRSYEWKLVTIRLDLLGASNTDIYGVEFQSATPATWSIDELKFSTQAGVCTP